MKQKTKGLITESEAFVKAILSKMPDIKKCKRDFILDCVLMFMSIKGKLNFLQLERYGHYRESTYRQNFESGFDYLQFNQHLSHAVCGSEQFIAFDGSGQPSELFA